MSPRIAALLLVLFASPVFAAADASRTRSPWESVGTMDVRYGGTVVRMTRFRNDEVLAEIEAAGGVKRYLRAQPSDSELYLGLADDELSIGRNPFQFLDIAFAGPLEALAVTYPEGPSTVPLVPRTGLVVASGKLFVLDAHRTADGVVVYRLDASGLAAPLGGAIDFGRPMPWPASQPMSQWKAKNAVRFETLGDARSPR